MQPEELPADYAQQVAAARLQLARADLRHAFECFSGARGYDVDDHTDEQRAEFLAFVAAEIDYDLADVFDKFDPSDSHLWNPYRNRRDSEAERGSGSQRSGPDGPASHW